MVNDGADDMTDIRREADPMTYRDKMQYQENGYQAKNLSEANAEIAKARSATPVEIRADFRSCIRYSVQLKAYEWHWILR